jgi:multicomponent K+:H+ antiporter subunit D
VLGSSLLALVGLGRTGTRLFWRTGEDEPARPASPSDLPKVGALEIGATVLLLGYGVAMGLAPAPVLRYTTAAAGQLLSPADYVREVRDTTPQVRAP